MALLSKWSQYNNRVILPYPVNRVNKTIESYYYYLMNEAAITTDSYCFMMCYHDTSHLVPKKRDFMFSRCDFLWFLYILCLFLQKI